MPLSPRSQSRKQQRAAAKRQRELDRRAEDLAEQLRDQARRQEALEEARAFAAELDAKEQKRKEVLELLRSQKREHAKKERLQEKKESDRDRVLNIVRRHLKAQDSIERRTEEQKRVDAAQALRRKKLQQATDTRPEETKKPRSEEDAKQRRLKESLERKKQEQRLKEQKETTHKERAEQAHAQAQQQRRAHHQAMARKDERQRMEEAAAKKRVFQDKALHVRLTDDKEREAAESKRQQLIANLRLEQESERKVQKKAAEQAVEQREALREELRQQRQLDHQESVAQQERQQQCAQELRNRTREEKTRREADEERREAARAAQRAAARSQEKDRANTTPKRHEQQAEAPTKPVLFDPLAQSVRSGSLPWLKTNGNRIVTLANDPVVLRGLTLTDWEPAGPPSPSLCLVEALCSWGATLIRLSMCRSSVVGDDGDTAESLLSIIDTLIEAAAARGAYTMLSLTRLDQTTTFGQNPDGSVCVWPPMPDADAIGMWRVLAQRYSTEPAVLYDLFTAPHPPCANDVSGFGYSHDRYLTWLQMTIAEVRLHSPAALCFVAAPQYGTDPGLFPVPGTAGAPIPNLVYTLHAIPSRPLAWPAVRSLARRFPFFVSSWDGSDPDLLWGERIASEFRSLGIGFCGGSGFGPPLYFSHGGLVAPTRFGAIIKRELARFGEAHTSASPAWPVSLPLTSFYA